MADDTLNALAAMIAEVMDEDLEDLEISRETSFSDDLELESIEFVALAELVQAKWGEKVDFNAWIAGKSIDEVISLSVGDLVAYVERCLAA